MKGKSTTQCYAINMWDVVDLIIKSELEFRCVTALEKTLLVVVLF